jgi:hypothetical protein
MKGNILVDKEVKIERHHINNLLRAINTVIVKVYNKYSYFPEPQLKFGYGKKQEFLSLFNFYS